MFQRSAICALAFFGLMASMAFAGEAAAIRTATYDIRDLIVDIPDFTVGGVPTTQPTREAMLAEALASIKSLMPENASVRELGGQLIINADDDGQAMAKQWVTAARAARSVQAMVETRVIRMDAATLAEMPAEFRTAFAVAGLNGARDPVELTPVSLEAIAFFTKDTTGSTTQLTAPRLTLFSGQQASVSVLSDMNYVKSLKAVAGKNGERTFKPEIDTVRSGVTMQARARTPADGSSVAVQFHLDLTRLTAIDSFPVEGGATQKPTLAVDRFDGLYALPKGKTLLLRPTEAAADTHNGLVAFAFGPAAEGEDKKQKGQPVLTSLTAEMIDDGSPKFTFVLLKATGIVPLETEAEPRPILREK